MTDELNDLFEHDDLFDENGDFKIEDRNHNVNSFEEIISEIAQLKKDKEQGIEHSIEWPFESLNKVIPGITKAKYILLSANQKVGKSALTDFIFVYHIVYLYYTGKIDIKPCIEYFTLEVDAKTKMHQAICHFLAVNNMQNKKFNPDYVLDPSLLRSQYKHLTLTDDQLEKIAELHDFFTVFNQCVTYIDGIRNISGIYNHMKDVASKKGTIHEIREKKIDSKGKEVIDYKHISYKPYNTKEWVFCIIDHYSLFSPESNLDLRHSIGKWSSEYAILLRNHYQFIIVGVQQQTAEKEKEQYTTQGSSIEAKLKPSADGLADNKTTSRDCNLFITVYDPSRHKIKTYKNIDLEKIIWKKEQDNFVLTGYKHREVSILLNRDGEADIHLQTIFNGKIQYFKHYKS